MKLGIVITDGVGYRNFILSNFISEAILQFDSIIIYSGLPKSAYHQITQSDITIKELNVFNEGKLTWFFRKWKEIAHLRNNQSFYGIKDNLITGYPKNNSVRSLLIKLIYFITKAVHNNKSIIFIEKLQFLTFSQDNVTNSYFRLLNKDQPSHVFFTHQRPSYLAPFLYAIIKLKIPVSTFIYSWDNLTSKGRMLGTFDYFLVWSNLMKEELLCFYPSVKYDNIKVVGTPQFEPYVMQKYETKKKDFYIKFNLDNEKKIICFSCADRSIGANDPKVIKAIANAIRNNRIETPSQLIVRTSPAEDKARFIPVMEEFPEIIWNVPKWILTRERHSEIWSQRVPCEEDIKDLRSLLEYGDLNINMCSTMSLDFMLFDKPVINTVFGNSDNGLFNDQRFLNFTHYKNIVKSQSVVIAKNEEDLVFHINNELKNPSERTIQRKRIINIQISEPLLHTSKRIAKTLFAIND